MCSGPCLVPFAVLCSAWLLCRVRLLATPWTAARQAPLSMGVSRQEHWSGLRCPSPADLPDSGIKPVSLISPALAGWFFTTSSTWEALLSHTTPFIPVTEQITAYNDPTMVQALLLSADCESYMARNCICAISPKRTQCTGGARRRCAVRRPKYRGR